MSSLRHRILEAAHRAGTGHVASALSIVDIVEVLHTKIMTGDSKFVLSKGHGALALYAVLTDGIPGISIHGLPGHPERGTPGIEVSTGSLGHGLPIAAGMAYGYRLQGMTAQVFCIVGDSELEEGSCWEAIHIAARRELGNLMVVVDANGNSPNQIDGPRHESSIARKFQAFGWYVSEVDGHDHAALANMLKPLHGHKPHAVVARTIKGKGVPIIEADPQAWHRRAPGAVAELQQMVASIY
jgi:transketolase